VSLSPRTIHLFEQFGGTLREVAQLVGAYKRDLIEAGLNEREAWVLTQKLELKLMGPVLDDTESLLREFDQTKE
jgi:hypothetical protein